MLDRAAVVERAGVGAVEAEYSPEIDADGEEVPTHAPADPVIAQAEATIDRNPQECGGAFTENTEGPVAELPGDISVDTGELEPGDR